MEEGEVIVGAFGKQDGRNVDDTSKGIENFGFITARFS